MRPIERIDNFLAKVNTIKMSNRWKLDTIWHINLLSMFTSDTFIKYWKENYDMRIGQALINFGIIPDNFSAWNDEEAEILMSQGLPIEECYYWTSHLDKDGKSLPKSTSKLLKDLDTDHIKAIIRYCEENYNTLNMKVCSYLFKRIYND
jgi:hypothetical protein